MSLKAVRIFGSINRALYRATGGKAGGKFKGAPVLLLTTTGRKTGKPRTMPLLYTEDGSNLVLIASEGGAPRHPAWFVNLKANPQVDAEIGRNRRAYTAREAEGDERTRLWAKMAAMYPPYDDYQRKTTRRIPVVVLEPR